MKKDSIDRIRNVLKGETEFFLNNKKIGKGNLLKQKPFSVGMYHFNMFMVSYYARVKEIVKIDYDSFMIVQTVVGNTLYNMKKKNYQSSSYKELESELEKSLEGTDNTFNVLANQSSKKLSQRLTLSSISLVTGLPKETVRRKTKILSNKKILWNTEKEGILLGRNYKKIFSEYVPETVLNVSNLLKNWEKNGILKALLNLKT